jgi:hypothetical protein
VFGLFKRKSQLEQLIAKDGIDHVAARFAEAVSQKLLTRKDAYQFILEELDGASQGNAAAQAFARNSGIPGTAYNGALGKSKSEIDGSEGPQQFLVALCMQLMPNRALMVEFRCRVDDNIMKRFRFGKYASKDEQVANLVVDLRKLLFSDDSLVPALHPDISPPDGATKRHVSRRGKDLVAAKDLISTLTSLTGEASRGIVLNAIASTANDGERLLMNKSRRVDTREPSHAPPQVPATKRSWEGVSQPVHIDFDSYEPVMKMGNRTLPNPCTFLVTVTNPSFRPTVKTCRVSGINHKRAPQGVQDGVVAHVNMCRRTDEGEFERVFVQLCEDGRVEGLLVRGGVRELITNLDDVYFMPGDTIWLDDAGEPLAQDDQPQPLPAQKRLLEAEREQRLNQIIKGC